MIRSRLRSILVVTCLLTGPSLRPSYAEEPETPESIAERARYFARTASGFGAIDCDDVRDDIVRIGDDPRFGELAASVVNSDNPGATMAAEQERLKLTDRDMAIFLECNMGEKYRDDLPIEQEDLWIRMLAEHYRELDDTGRRDAAAECIAINPAGFIVDDVPPHHMMVQSYEQNGAQYVCVVSVFTRRAECESRENGTGIYIEFASGTPAIGMPFSYDGRDYYIVFEDIFKNDPPLLPRIFGCLVPKPDPDELPMPLGDGLVEPPPVTAPVPTLPEAPELPIERMPEPYDPQDIEIWPEPVAVPAPMPLPETTAPPADAYTWNPATWWY